MNEKAKIFLSGREASLGNATRYADGEERLRYDIQFVKQYLPTGNEVCVDLCCGTGMMSVEMAKMSAKVYAVDFNPAFLEMMPDTDNIDKIASDANSYCCDEKVDLVTIFGAIQYNQGDDVKQIYENCYKMLKPGGTLVVSGQWGVEGKVIVDNFSEELQTYYFAEYRTTEEETNLLKSIGFKTDIVDILPEKFNRFTNTHFYGIVAEKPINALPNIKYKQTIGVIGGMGSYATIDFFDRLVKAFPAAKEWDRPRILIDNRCTMPSRVRAILYDENYDYILSELCESTKHLLAAGADYLVLACNTSHYFLEGIENKVPEAKGKFVNIIKTLGEDIIVSSNERKFRLLASEGTIESKIYEKYLEEYGIKISTPSKAVYSALRDIIEAVKQDSITEQTYEKFLSLLDMDENKNIIIGCTEFPIVYRKIKDRIERAGYNIFDPLESTINRIVKNIR